MKAIKTIGIVVGVVALVATGVGLAMGGAVAGAAAGTAGATAALGATLMSVGAIASVAAGVISLGTALFAPKPGFSSQGNPLQFQTNPQSGLPYAIGRTRMSGLRIHADTYDATSYKSEGKQDVLSFAVLLSAGGESEEIESFRADKEVVAFNGTTGMATGTHANFMAQKVSLGLAGASALALAFGGGNFPGWTADHKLSGMTHALWDLRFDEKGEHFGAGVPEPEWVGKWVKVYDPRLDSTYPGGSGSHRALDESTYEWSANPYLHGLTWALGRWQNGKKTLGIGAPVENIRVADFVEGANVADANGWTCGGVEWSTDPKWTILKKMLQAGGGEPTMTGAMIGCRVNTPRVPVATVTADKLLDRLTSSTTRSRRDRFNTVIPRYRSEDHEWEVISGSPVSVSAYVTEDGGQRTKEIDFPLVQHEGTSDGNVQAGQLAAYEIVNSREGGPIRLTVGPEYIGVKSGDVIVLDVPEEGFDEQPVLIRSRSVDPATFKITFEGETETESKHAFALGESTTPPPTYSPTPPDLTPPTPDAALWDLVALPATELTPAFAIQGVCEFPGADDVLLEYREDGAADWITLSPAEASSPVNHVINGLIANTAYEARVAYRSDNRVGGWLELAPVTVNSVALNDVLEANDQNDGPPASTGAITSITQYLTYPDGNVSYRASFTYDYDAAPLADDNVDGFIVGYYAADTNAAYTMLGPDSSDKEVWYVRYKNLTPGVATYTEIFFNNRGPTKFYKLGVAPFRKVDKAVDPKGYIIGPIVQSAFFQPAATQAITGTGLTIGGQTATNVGAGASKANTGLTVSGNVASTTKVGGDSGQAASDVSTATQRGLVVINANNNINTGVKIGGDSGQVASNVSDAATRALAAITSGNKAATNVVETISLTSETVTHLFAGSTSSTAVALDGGSYGTYVSVASSSFTVQEGGADVLFLGLVSVRFGISATDSNLQFTATARITFDGVNSNTFEVTQTVTAAGRNTTAPIVISHLFEGVAAGSRTFTLAIKVDDPSGSGDYAETRGVRAVQIMELKR